MGNLICPLFTYHMSIDKTGKLQGISLFTIQDNALSDLRIYRNKSDKSI